MAIMDRISHQYIGARFPMRDNLDASRVALRITVTHSRYASLPFRAHPSTGLIGRNKPGRRPVVGRPGSELLDEDHHRSQHNRVSRTCRRLIRTSDLSPEPGGKVPMIHAAGLSKIYASGTGVFDVSFSAERGRVLALLGLNGAGKSTIQGLMLGYINGQGVTRFGEKTLAEIKQQAIGSVGFALQPNGLPPSYTVESFLGHHVRRRSASRRVDTGELLATVELDVKPSTRIRSLSVGMRQRLALAAAFSCEPDYLILDEPSNGLDFGGRDLVRRLIRGAADEGAAVVVSSHVLEDLHTVADDAALLSKGRLLDHNSIDALAARWQLPGVTLTVSDEPTVSARLREANLAHSSDGDTITVYGAKPSDVARLCCGVGDLHHLA